MKNNQFILLRFFKLIREEYKKEYQKIKKTESYNFSYKRVIKIFLPDKESLKLNKKKYYLSIIIILLYQLLLNVFHNEKCMAIIKKRFDSSSEFPIFNYIESIKCLYNQPLTNYKLYSFTFDMKLLIVLTLTIIYISMFIDKGENPETTEKTTIENKIDKSLNIENTMDPSRLLIEMSIVYFLVIKYSIILIILYIGLFLVAAPIITWFYEYISGL